MEAVAEEVRRGSPQSVASVESRGVVQLLVLPEAYRAPRQHLFQSEESLKWHMRVHRKRLADAGALYLIGGRLWIQPGAFDQVLLEEGRTGAAGSDD